LNPPYISVLFEALKQARNRPRTPYYYQLSSLVQEYLQPAIDNNGSLDPVMDGLADALKNAQDGQ